MNISGRHFFLIFVVIFALVQCEFLRKTVGIGPMPPKASLLAFRAKKVSTQSLELEFDVQVKNPNFFGITMSKLNYDVSVGDIELAKGIYAESLSIPRESDRVISLPLIVTPSSAVKVLNMLWQKQKIIATWKAVASFDTYFGEVDVAFKENKALAF
jgi:LEA14-like dessication related protein